MDAKTSAMGDTVFRPELFFVGRTEGSGIVRDAFGRILRRCEIVTVGSRQAAYGALQMEETFSFDDGEVDVWRWVITAGGEGRYMASEQIAGSGLLAHRDGDDYVLSFHRRDAAVAEVACAPLRHPLQPAVAGDRAEDREDQPAGRAAGGPHGHPSPGLRLTGFDLTETPFPARTVAMAEVYARLDETPPELLELRHSIDNIDAAVLHMLAERFKCTRRVGELKARLNLAPADPEREAAQIARLRSLAVSADLAPEFAEKFLNFLVREVIRHHEQIRQDAQ